MTEAPHRIWANIEDEGDGPFIEMLSDEPWSDENPGTAYVLADWQPIETAPKDGTMLLLVVTSTSCHALEDVGVGNSYVTIGHNSKDNGMDDAWQTVGWSWSHDCFLDIGGAMQPDHFDTPIMWRPLPAPPTT